MPGIEKLDKKKKSITEPATEPPKPAQPAWVASIPDMIFKCIGGKPQGYVKHDLHPKWDNKFRLDVLTKTKHDGHPGKPDSGTTVEKYLSWWLVFTPDGELISSAPPLPGSVTPAQVKELIEGE